MTDRNNICKMYSQVTASEDIIENCIESVKSQRHRSISVKRVMLVAACLVLIVAILVPAAGALKHISAYKALDEYAATLPYPEKQGTDNSMILQNSDAANGAKITAQTNDLKIVAQDIYFDGVMVCISFAGEYSGEYKDVFRFDYTDTEADEFVVDGVSVAPLYHSSFYILKTGDTFSGILRLPCNSDKDEVNVSICIPYLQLSDDEDMPLVIIDGDFTFELTARKGDDVRTYSGEKNDTAYIKKITSSSAGFNLECFVSESQFSNDSNIQPMITDEAGNTVKIIMGKVCGTENGNVKVWYCEPTETDSVNIVLYNKNSSEIVAEFNNVILN